LNKIWLHGFRLSRWDKDPESMELFNSETLKRDMKKIAFIALFCSVLLACSRNDVTPLSGEVTISNEVFLSDTYYSYGFNFALASKVTTMNDPRPDITVEYGLPEGETQETGYFAANTYQPSFNLYGEYSTLQEALTAFNSLRSFGTRVWSDSGIPLAGNQVWLIRTGSGTYAKIIITTLTTDTGTSPAFIECTFRWVYQPDGTETFNE